MANHLAEDYAGNIGHDTYAKYLNQLILVSLRTKRELPMVCEGLITPRTLLLLA